MADEFDPAEVPSEKNTQPENGPAETTDAGTEGLETVSYAGGQTDHAIADVPPVADDAPSTASAEKTGQEDTETAGDTSDVKAEGTEATEAKSESGLDRVLDITIGAVVVAAEAARQAVQQVRENGPDVAKNFEEKGRPIREKLAAQIKERGFGPSTLPLVDPDGTDPMDKTSTVPGATKEIGEEAPEEIGSKETVEAGTETAATATPVKPPVVLPPGSSAADEISLLERRVRAMEQEVSPFDPERLSDSDGIDVEADSQTPADAATYVPGEWGEDKSETEDDPQLVDSPYAVSETDEEQARESETDSDNDKTPRPAPDIAP